MDDAQQIFGRGDWGHRPDLGDLVAAGRCAALRTKREQPDFARGFNR
jgi:hypothetical protein